MSLAAYIEEHKTRRPPDHLFSEWIQRPGSGGQLEGRDGSAGGRPFFAFRHNILYHVGSESSLGHESRIIVPKCYDTLQDWLQPWAPPTAPPPEAGAAVPCARDWSIVSDGILTLDLI